MCSLGLGGCSWQQVLGTVLVVVSRIVGGKLMNGEGDPLAVIENSAVVSGTKKSY